jgi:hypothetical protein
MYRLGQYLEFVALDTRAVQKIGGGGLAGKKQNLAVRMVIAASMPFMSVMMTSEMSMSGRRVRAVSTAFSPL